MSAAASTAAAQFPGPPRDGARDRPFRRGARRDAPARAEAPRGIGSCARWAIPGTAHSIDAAEAEAQHIARSEFGFAQARRAVCETGSAALRHFGLAGCSSGAPGCAHIGSAGVPAECAAWGACAADRCAIQRLSQRLTSELRRAERTRASGSCWRAVVRNSVTRSESSWRVSGITAPQTHTRASVRAGAPTLPECAIFVRHTCAIYVRHPQQCAARGGWAKAMSVLRIQFLRADLGFTVPSRVPAVDLRGTQGIW